MQTGEYNSIRRVLLVFNLDTIIAELPCIHSCWLNSSEETVYSLVPMQTLSIEKTWGLMKDMLAGDLDIRIILLLYSKLNK